MTITTLFIDVVVVLVLLSAVLALAWAVQQRTGNSSWIDFGWTAAVAAVSTIVTLFGAGAASLSAREILVAALIACWGLRLGGHLLARARRGVDDPRYADLARRWGDDAPWRMFWFAQSQALAALPLAFAVLLAARRPDHALDVQDVVGGLIVVLAIIGAALSDAQLRRFASDPANRGKVCDRGLWAWSRHPNYFFEWLGWVGFAVIALPLGGGSAIGWFATVAPIEMYGLLVYVSGIPLLEAHMERSRPAVWAAYKARTNALFPWPPKAPPN